MNELKVSNSQEFSIEKLNQNINTWIGKREFLKTEICRKGWSLKVLLFGNGKKIAQITTDPYSKGTVKVLTLMGEIRFKSFYEFENKFNYCDTKHIF